MARTTISLPDELVSRMEPLRDRMNVSEICGRALETRVSAYEAITAALSEEQVMEKLIDRLRLEQQETGAWSREQGIIHGKEFALNYCTVTEFEAWSSDDFLGSRTWDEVAFLFKRLGGRPESAFEWVLHMHEQQQDDVTFVARSYLEGFKSAVREVWDSVKDKV